MNEQSRCCETSPQCTKIACILNWRVQNAGPVCRSLLTVTNPLVGGPASHTFTEFELPVGLQNFVAPCADICAHKCSVLKGCTRHHCLSLT